MFITDSKNVPNQISQQVGHFGALCNTTGPGDWKTSFAGRDLCPICPRPVRLDAPLFRHLGHSKVIQRSPIDVGVPRPVGAAEPHLSPPRQPALSEAMSITNR
jgi:hypothetical protein